MIFDVLSLDGRSLMVDEGDALFEAVCERELEGIVAKGLDSRDRPGERGCVKVKNRKYG